MQDSYDDSCGFTEDAYQKNAAIHFSPPLTQQLFKNLFDQENVNQSKEGTLLSQDNNLLVSDFSQQQQSAVPLQSRVLKKEKENNVNSKSPATQSLFGATNSANRHGEKEQKENLAAMLSQQIAKKKYQFAQQQQQQSVETNSIGSRDQGHKSTPKIATPSKAISQQHSSHELLLQPNTNNFFLSPQDHKKAQYLKKQNNDLMTCNYSKLLHFKDQMQAPIAQQQPAQQQQNLQQHSLIYQRTLPSFNERSSIQQLQQVQNQRKSEERKTGSQNPKQQKYFAGTQFGPSNNGNNIQHVKSSKVLSEANKKTIALLNVAKDKRSSVAAGTGRPSEVNAEDPVQKASLNARQSATSRTKAQKPQTVQSGANPEQVGKIMASNSTKSSPRAHTTVDEYLKSGMFDKLFQKANTEQNQDNNKEFQSKQVNDMHESQKGNNNPDIQQILLNNKNCNKGKQETSIPPLFNQYFSLQTNQLQPGQDTSQCSTSKTPKSIARVVSPTLFNNESDGEQPNEQNPLKKQQQHQTNPDQQTDHDNTSYQQQHAQQLKQLYMKQQNLKQAPNRKQQYFQYQRLGERSKTQQKENYQQSIQATTSSIQQATKQSSQNYANIYNKMKKSQQESPLSSSQKGKIQQQQQQQPFSQSQLQSQQQPTSLSAKKRADIKENIQELQLLQKHLPAQLQAQQQYKIFDALQQTVNTEQHRELAHTIQKQRVILDQILLYSQAKRFTPKKIYMNLASQIKDLFKEIEEIAGGDQQTATMPTSMDTQPVQQQPVHHQLNDISNFTSNNNYPQKTNPTVTTKETLQTQQCTEEDGKKMTYQDIEELIDRNKKWLETKEVRLKKMREQQKKSELQQCTFQPQIYAKPSNIGSKKNIKIYH